ncbi:MAG TPA: hypothetical protein DCM68_05665 [Verrucomicrobia bacterium]|nr:hypothetical protein [Verrucomicrobiota bacterium]
MGELSNALQGKMNSRKGHVKDPASRQLDLFSSLTDRAATSPKFAMPAPETRPEPEMVLPSSSAPPSDVSADVRAVLSESGASRPVEPSTPSGEAHPLRTGIYHRPRYAPAPVPPPPPRSPSRPRSSPIARISAWFAGVEMDRRMVSLVVVLIVLVGLVAFWTARPRGPAENPEPSADMAPAPSAEEARVPAAPVSAAPSPVSSPPALPAPDWKIPGTEISLGGGAYLVRFTDPVFVSTDRISVEGWRALKAVAAKLATLKAGTRVVVTGYTDDVPMSKPTPQFQDNADLAAARAKVATEHLAQFARTGKGLVFEAQPGAPGQAPFPNDSPANRRLNRTVTVQVFPAP